MIPASKDPLKFIQFDKVPRLVEKYKGLVALPLALPKFKLADETAFWNIWNSTVENVTRQHIDRGAQGVEDPSMSVVQWQGISVYENLFLLNKLAWNTKLSAELAQSQDSFVKQIFQSLPFIKFRSIRFWSAVMPIPAHYDGSYPEQLNGVFDFPTEFRIMLYDENPQQTFWLTNAAKHSPHTAIDNQDKIYIKLPSDANAFVWNNESHLHGADFDPKYKKILVVIKGWITDMDQYEQLLDNSINKYSDFILKDYQ